MVNTIEKTHYSWKEEENWKCKGEQLSTELGTDQGVSGVISGMVYSRPVQRL